MEFPQTDVVEATRLVECCGYDSNISSIVLSLALKCTESGTVVPEVTAVDEFCGPQLLIVPKNKYIKLK